MHAAPQADRPAVKRLSLQRFFRGEGPEAGPIVLQSRRVYILPSKMGVYFAAMMLVMLLGAINYSNSMGFALTFLLASICLVTILHCYRNLLNLRVDVGPVPSVFCGDTVQVPVILDNQQHAARYAIRLRFHTPQTQPRARPHAHQSQITTDVVADHWQRTDLPLSTEQRGLHPLPRITLRSTFPLGLFQSWAHAHRDAQYLVYPNPDAQHNLPNEAHYQLNLSGDRGHGSDDFAGLRNYQQGDSLRHVHWKAAAREQGMHTKQFGGDRAEQLWLDWESLPGMETEARLSRLTRWVLDADNAQFDYGLRLPGTLIAIGAGAGHRHQCLKALALFNPTSFNPAPNNEPDTGQERHPKATELHARP